MRHAFSTAFKSVSVALFERGGLRAAFEHARNLVVATIFVGTGLEVVRRSGSLDIRWARDPTQAGYVVAAVGAVLIVLNLLDGLRQLSQSKRHRLWQFALAVLYFFFSLRIVQLIVVLRGAQC